MDVRSTGDGSLTLFAPDYNQEYHSRDGAWFETQKLYMDASGIKDRLRDPITATRVLDVGFGLGYTFTSTLLTAANIDRGRIHVTSFEKERDLVVQYTSGLATWQRGWDRRSLEIARALTNDTKAASDFELEYGGHSGQVFVLEGSTGLASKLEGTFDFIWQDPFSPGTNPELWNREWFTLLRQHSRPTTRLLTYSCARIVKDNLSAAGWSWQRIDAHGTKRHWLMATPNQ